MKKKIGCILLATMILSLVGCGEETNQYGTVKLGKYKGLEETRYVNEITDDDIQCEINYLMEQNPELVSVERKIENEDFIEADLTILVDNEVFGGYTDISCEFIVGDNEYGEKFDKEIAGANVGENRKFTITYDEDCDYEELQNKTVDFDVTITAIYEMHKPELTEMYIKEYLGYDSEEDMKNQIRIYLQKEYDEQEENQLESELIEKVIETSKVLKYDDDLYIEMKDYVEDICYLGDLSNLTDEELEERTLFYVTKKIVVEQIAINEGLVVTDEEYSKKVEEEADSLMQSVEEYENEYENKKEDILYDLLEEKVMRFLVDNAKITEEDSNHD